MTGNSKIVGQAAWFRYRELDFVIENLKIARRGARFRFGNNWRLVTGNRIIMGKALACCTETMIFDD